MKKFLTAAFVLCAVALSVFAGGDETAPIVVKEFEYKDWTFKNLKDNSNVNLREFAKDKKLVLVVYFAAWCPNWQREAPLVERLYQKYKDKGFGVVGVSEFAPLDDARKNVAENNLSFTVVSESEKYEDREKATLYGYRTAAGDTRKWGSPWNLFLETKEMKKKGETIGNKFSVVNGEMIEAEVDAFIREKLGITNGKRKTENGK
jgi:peroxiredoxin